MSVIATSGLGYRYPGAASPSLRDVDLTVDHGRIVILEGPSGGGKTTLLRVLGGLAPAFHGGEAEGRAHVAGLNLRTAAPADVAQRVGLLFQDPEAQSVLSEPLRDVAFSLQCRAWPADRILPAARVALDRVSAAHLIGRRIDALSAGERQRVALAAVLAPEPDVLLLDEPTAQLDDDGACELVGRLRTLADRGLTIVLSEHRRDRIAHLADETIGVVGGVIALPPEQPAYPPRDEAPSDDAPPVLLLEHVAIARGDRTVIHDATCALAAGRAVALVGANGAGKSTILRAIAGLERPAQGVIRTDRRVLDALAAEERVPELRLVPQDPGRFLLERTTADEIGHATRALGLPSSFAERAIADLGLEHLLDRSPHDLSVGERERVALAAALAADPRILLLDEPTRGMDPGYRLVLARLIRERCARGYATLVASHDRAFIAASCDGLWAIEDGRILGEQPIPQRATGAAS